MKKLLLLFIVACLATNAVFAQKGMFKKKDKKAAEEQIDDVEEKIKEETKELKEKTEPAATPKAKPKAKPIKEKEKSAANNKISEMSVEAARKMADIKEQMQQKITVEEGEASMSTGLQNGYIVFVKGGSANKVEKHWKKYLKSAFNGKTDLDKNGEILAQSVNIPSVGEAVNIFARIKEVSDGVEVTTFYDAGKAGYLTSANVDGHELIEKIMYDFGVQERVFAIEQQIEDEEKALKRLEKDLKNLKDDNDKYLRIIEKAKLDIVENERDQTDKNAEITEQMNIIEAVEKMKDGVE